MASRNFRVFDRVVLNHDLPPNLVIGFDLGFQLVPSAGNSTVCELHQMVDSNGLTAAGGLIVQLHDVELCSAVSYGCP